MQQGASTPFYLQTILCWYQGYIFAFLFSLSPLSKLVWTLRVDGAGLEKEVLYLLLHKRMISFKSQNIIIIFCNLFHYFFLTEQCISGYNDVFDFEYLYQPFSDWYFVRLFAAAFHLSDHDSQFMTIGV